MTGLDQYDEYFFLTQVRCLCRFLQDTLFYLSYSSAMKFVLLFICLALCSSFAHAQLQKERGRRFALFVRAVVEAWSVRAQVSGWSRFDIEEDDNPGIQNCMGHLQVELIKAIEMHSLYFKIPFFAKYPSYDFKYSYPMSEGIRWMLSYQSGYGHSLIEYNRHTQRLGVGFLLEDILY